MPRRKTNRDFKGRRCAVLSELEVRQAAEIDSLRRELRAVRAELRDRPAKPVRRRAPPPADYGSVLDGIWLQMERLVEKGRIVHGTCECCGNVKLPNLLPLFEGERIDYEAGERDDLVFSPALASGGVTPPDPEAMKAAFQRFLRWAPKTGG